MSTETLILNQVQLLQKIKRIAYEIYENNFQESEMVVAGIAGNGFIFADYLKKELEQISQMRISLVKVMLEKTSQTQADIALDIPTDELINKTIIITDDVLNTGRVLAYSLKPFLNLPVKKLQTAVIVDRNHQSFPIAADYVGYSLATTIREHIEVSFLPGKFGVYLH